MKKQNLKYETITRRDGSQVNVAINTDQVKADMKPATEKTRKCPGDSESGQKMKEEVLDYFQRFYPKCLLHFAGNDYKAVAKWSGPEDILHFAAVAYCREYHPQLLVIHPKNEGKETGIGQGKKKLMGVLPGVSDLEIHRHDTPVTLWMELKVRPNRLSLDQRKFLEFQKTRGNVVIACYEIQEVVEAVDRYARADFQEKRKTGPRAWHPNDF